MTQSGGDGRDETTRRAPTRELVAPPGLARERWDGVPAVSDDFRTARDAIVARLARLLDECAKS
jgi:hypothetical protein